MDLKEICMYLDDILKINEIDDYSINGLQVENNGVVTKAACAVDASVETFEKAINIGADFILVHHGILWKNDFRVTGNMYERVKMLVDNNISLYAAHLPLDIHPVFGNNSRISDVLGWESIEDFGKYHGMLIGKLFRFNKPKKINEIAEEIKTKIGGEPVLWPFGKAEIKSVAYISGGGISMLNQAIEADIDCFITGEPAHSAFWLAKEAGINVIFAGHYYTETLGVKSIAKELKNKFKIDTEFIELPTGY